MSYPPPAGGGYGYPQAGGGYPPQQSPYPGGSQPPYGQQQPPYPGGTQPPYGQQQPPYPGGPPQPTPYGAPQSQVTLGFDNLSIQPNQTGGMQMSGQSHSPYPAPAPSSYGQPQQPTFGGVAYAAQAAHTFQQAGGYNQPPSGYGAPPQTSYTQQPPSQQYAPYTQPAAPKQPTPPSRPAPPQSTQNYPTSTSTYQSHSTSQTLPQEPATQGTIRGCSSFDGQQDAAALRKAMKGIGTDEKTITNIIGTRSNAQRQKIKLEFATLYGKDLIKELKSELSGNYESTVLALLMKPDDYDAYCLNAAMEGAGTDEKALIELLCTRTNAQIKASSQAYKRMYKRDLEKELISETSGHFKRLLVSLVQGARLENDPLDRNRAVADAKALYCAGEARWGTDESRFNVILGSRSNAQLRLTFDEYSKISKRTMEKAISSEMSGDLKDGMLAIVKCARNRPAFFAERLHWSMKGLGTNDRTLIRIMVSRSEIDMVQIKQEFQNKYNKSLHSYIADDCSGDYKKLLLQICGGR